jgi:hypothetical protein
VDPTVSGYYQANILGKINEIPVSFSMHPPKVNERANIEFPKKADLTIEQIIDGHTALINEISSIKQILYKSMSQTKRQILLMPEFDLE